MAQSKPWRIVSWSSPVGAQSLTYETLNGLKAMLAFLNANGGLDGRQLEMYHLEMDDGWPDFPAKLNSLIQKENPDIIVGGASLVRPQETADFFRRINRPWFGPWSNSRELYQNLPNDPIGLFPTVEKELELLLNYAKTNLPAGAPLTFILQDSQNADGISRTVTSLSAQKDLEITIRRLSPNFRNWQSLGPELTGSGAIILWTPPGPAVAIVRELKKKLPNTVLWMTHSLNSPGTELKEMTGSTWEKMIFPAILKPTSELPTAYDVVLRKYALPGLNLDYHSFLGFGQGQILARILQNATSTKKKRPDFYSIFKSTSGQGTILTRQNLQQANPPEGSFYLGQALANGNWIKLE
jgi:ABC-type branched-subunit amino acid transport system substrate-binding protein